MYHQFAELADVDITAEPMEVGPTCHYVMGGVEVDPDTAAIHGPGPVRGRVSAPAGCTGRNRLGGNSLSDLLVFGRRAGVGAAEYVDALGGSLPEIAEETVQAAADAGRRAVREGGPAVGENPYTLHADLQQTMNDLVGIIRREQEIEQALVTALDELAARAEQLSVEGHRQFNPGWHLALDLRNMLLVSRCVAEAALLRTESRGGHTREDFPEMDPPSGAAPAGLLAGRRRRCRVDDVLQPPVPAGPARPVRGQSSWRSTSPTRSW